VLVREVTALYDAYSRGKESPLPELPIQYADYAVWQRKWLAGEVLEKQLAYWRGQLEGAPEVLELPTDRPRPPAPSHRGARYAFRLPEGVSAGLKELSRKEGATLFMVLLGAFDVLLSRYTGQEDIVVGTDIANRNRAETEGLIGFFVNQLVLRTDMSGNPSFRELIRRVREMALAAYAHQDLPFEKLVEELRPERDLSRSPLFQVKLVLQNAPPEVMQMGGLSIKNVSGDTETIKYDLLLTMFERAGELVGAWLYSTDLFDLQTIAKIHGSFGALLRNITEHPETRVNRLEMRTELEKQQEVLKESELTNSQYRKFINAKPKPALIS
jgi:non-ribosomal peptide synthetase component F